MCAVARIRREPKIADDTLSEFKDLKPIGKPVRHKGCTIKVLPKPRHPPMKIPYKPPWNNSPPSPKEVVIMRPKDGGRPCEEKARAEQSPSFRIVNGWQVTVDEVDPESPKTMPPSESGSGNDGGFVMRRWDHDSNPGLAQPCPYRRSVRDR